MGEQASQEHGGNARATDLIADFQSRHEAWRRQGENLERLRADARAAAALEAAAVLTTARGEIRRVIMDARRALLELTASLKVITDQAGAAGDPDSNEDVPYSVLQARRDLARLLTDMRPELDDLTEQAEQLAEPNAPNPSPAPVPEPPVVPEVEIEGVEHDAALAAIAPLFEQELDADRAAEVAEDSTPPMSSTPPVAAPRSGIRGSVMLVAAIGVAVAGGAGWWLSDAYRSEDLTRTVASIPPARRVKPAWLDDHVPTINATLVGVPSAAPAAAEPPYEAAPAVTPASGGPDTGR